MFVFDPFCACFPRLLSRGIKETLFLLTCWVSQLYSIIKMKNNHRVHFKDQELWEVFHCRKSSRPRHMILVAGSTSEENAEEGRRR